MLFRKTLNCYFFVFLVCVMGLALFLQTMSRRKTSTKFDSESSRLKLVSLNPIGKFEIPKILPSTETAHSATPQPTMTPATTTTAPTKRTSSSRLNYNLHAFYYPWYGEPKTDGKWIHWNHPYMPHWDQSVTDRYPKGSHIPPDDIGSTYYPLLGPYSSRSKTVIEEHMKYFVRARIGVSVISWYPPGKADNNGTPSDSLVPVILDLALAYDVKIAFHSEPYKERNGDSFASDIRYLVDTYGNHPATYKIDNKIVMYVYDAYHTPIQEWNRVLASLNSDKRYGVFSIVLLLQEAELDNYVRGSRFDGVYTYFASNTFTFGSNTGNWNIIQQLCKQHKKVFIPSVGPGYDDTRVRPWNGENIHYRRIGEYYNQSFGAAVSAGVSAISITSFNEWHEGTQIEPAVPKQTYSDYNPQSPFFYLDVTADWAEKLKR
eukprot:PhF_6_TR35076/c0_g1_i1/m.51118/K15538/MANEA; glycoprotein endo-alpha-1,2-mannosidase